MAALYLHNALFTPESLETRREHTRTISSTTLRTITTDQSHPTEPLLYSTNSGSLAYQDLLSRQPEYSNRPYDGLSLDDPALTSAEKHEFWEQSVRKRLRILKLTSFLLKVVLGLWALYNTIRYFIAYTIYESLQGQVAAIALGSSAAVCLTFLICAAILSVFQSYLIRAHIPIHSLLILRTVFRYLGSFFLISPAIVNIALAVVWRNSSIPEIVPQLRCHLDIDIVWSVTNGNCNRTTSAQWLGLAIFRVAFTLIIIVSFLYTSSAYDGTRRPSQSLQRRRKRKRRHMESEMLTTSPPTSASSQLPLFPGHPSRYPSRSTIAENNRRTLDHSLRDSQASSSEFDPSTTSDENEMTLDPPRFDPLLMQQRLNNAITPFPLTGTTENDLELNNFADRFRVLVSQISHETDDALRISRIDADNSEPFLPPEDIYTNMSNSNHPYSYDEYGYPADDHIHILNGIVRRMPTIESLGSRELISIASTHDRDRDRFSSLSRPPTRSVTEFTGSEPPSRANSLSLTAAIGGHGLTATEMGELMEKIGKDKEQSINTATTAASASRSTFSYYTAQSNGRTSPVPLTPSSEHFSSSSPSLS